MIFGDAPSGPGGVAPMATWGSSYALSTEDWQWWYHGRAKAAANVYSGKRIIQVCIWYTRGADRVSPKVCSNAVNDSGGWSAGPERRTECIDTIDPNAPQTMFNITTSRINPNIS